MMRIVYDVEYAKSLVYPDRTWFGDRKNITYKGVYHGQIDVYRREHLKSYGDGRWQFDREEFSINLTKWYEFEVDMIRELKRLGY